VCWSFDRRAQYVRAARQFLADGLAAGQQVWYVAPGMPSVIVDEVADIPGFMAGLASGAARIVDVEQAYPTGFVVDPSAQVDFYARATDAAIAAGYQGLRITAEATSLVVTDRQLAAFTRYEHLVDRQMIGQPFSAMCGYDRSLLGDRTITELDCMHPATNTNRAQFRLHGCAPAAGHVALSGELDIKTRDLLPTALRRSVLASAGPRMSIDASGLTFVDYRSLKTLGDFAGEHDATVTLRNAPAMSQRIADLVPIQGLQIDPSRS